MAIIKQAVLDNLIADLDYERAQVKALRAELAALREAHRRIAEHQSRADRRHRGMVDASEVQDLQRISRTALAAGEGE
jgi:hypothetical protein